MKIGVVVNDISTEEAWYDTTLLLSAAVHKGHDVYIMGVGDLNYMANGHMGAFAVKVKNGKSRSMENFLKNIQADAKERVHISSEELDVIFLRNNPCEDIGDRAWAQTAGMIFGQIALEKGVLVLNDPYSLMTAFNKMYFQHFPEEVRPRTLISRNADDIKEFYKEQGEKIILKPLQGSGGKDVFLMDNSTNLNQIVESINRYGYVIAQEYLPAAKDGDIRVIMLNGKILEIKGKSAAMHRVNKADDIRSNIHAGGVPQKAQITDEIRRLCNIVGPKLKRDGMFMAGIDIVGDKIMELNLDSPGGIVSIEKLEKEKFAAKIIDAIEKKIEYQKYYDGKLPNSYLATLDV
ncbi:ATP-grasp domain-containing protein [Litoribacter ruber]|uniref:Glutathione synthetase n=1 Tax=Litoribacter ruber TaxID=702568 RepID=A0AAP2CMT4_9BACT|nr:MULTISPECIES: glutathione synthetase [Litoribacter]MBS9525450.1 ATP-grasp domain-containing protein [Litoribacter alkaliphilus]MBT0813082.1 ATP-grasp domain-containing protein [Litoribacter ruber]